jgi:thiol-disulfide isomerase/thioredoxin
MPVWKRSAEKMEQSKLAVVQAIARSNAPVDEFMKYHNITSYPTIMMFHRGETQRFSGERTENNLLDFVRIAKSPLIMFMHWSKCGHCHTVRPIWDRLKNTFKDDRTVSLREYEAEEMMRKYNVSSFPTFLRVMDNQVTPYEGDRTYESLHAFVKPRPKPNNPKKPKRAARKRAIVPPEYKSLTRGDDFWAIKADNQKHEICIACGKQGGVPTFSCSKYRGKKTLDERIDVLIARMRKADWKYHQ